MLAELIALLFLPFIFYKLQGSDLQISNIQFSFDHFNRFPQLRVLLHFPGKRACHGLFL